MFMSDKVGNKYTEKVLKYNCSTIFEVYFKYTAEVKIIFFLVEVGSHHNKMDSL